MRVIAFILCVFCALSASLAQDGGDNSSPGSIAGTYSVLHQGEESKVEIYACEDGTFEARTVWVKNKYDSNGNVRLDEKNPDKSLRGVECDKILILEGMKYNRAKKRWDGGKIYDPTRGIKANATCEFESPHKLKVRGTLLGIGETVIWQKI